MFWERIVGYGQDPMMRKVEGTSRKVPRFYIQDLMRSPPRLGHLNIPNRWGHKTHFLQDERHYM